MSRAQGARTRVWQAGIAGAMLVLASAALAQQAAVLGGIPHVDEIIVEHGTELEDALAQLPRTVPLVTRAGETVEVEVHWGLSPYVETARGNNIVRQSFFPDARGPYEVAGTFALPEGVQRPDTSTPLLVTSRITVQDADELMTFDDPLFVQPGEYGTLSLRFGNVERTFSVYLPSTYDGSEEIPVMITFHGPGSSGIAHIAYTGFDLIAEQEGFVVVAPDYGIHATGRFERPRIGDFTAAIIDELSARLRIDQRRIYASGMAMGGGAAFVVAEELSDRIAGIGVVGTAARPMLERTLPRPTTVVWFYGNRDEGYGPEIYQTLANLVRQNEASERPDIHTWTPTEDDPTSITRFTYDNGEEGSEVIFYRVEEGGHTWPGKHQRASLIEVGLTSQHVDASALIWEHLSEHELPEAVDRRVMIE
jgi:polyhydroxybutyrate depolymerase